jgi:Cu/Zn superoxide dismutase
MRSFGSLALMGLVAAATAQETGQLGDATKNLDNPAGAAYQAVLPENGPIQGSVVAVTNENQGVDFAVNFKNLPKEGGPFPFHIHVAPIPADGNCTGALAHLDPFIRGEATPCNPAKPETCQVGDLSGKYGKAGTNCTSYKASFTDPYVSLKPGIGAFFGNRSIVIHYANKTRITCANFTWISQPVGSNSTYNMTSMTRTPTPMSPAAPTSAPGSEGSQPSSPKPSSSPPAVVSTGDAGALSIPASIIFATTALMWALGL